MTDGRAQLLAQYPTMRFLDAPEALTVRAASNDGVKLQMADGDGKLRIRSLASTPAKNSYGFRVDQKAFVDAMGEFRKNPVMLAYHYMDRPIGRWDIGQSVTPEGLVLEGWISATEPEIQGKVLDGTLSRASVAFIPIAEQEDEDGVTMVTKLRLFEVSLVPIPADAGTMVEPLAESPPAAPEAALPLAQVVQDEEDVNELVVLGVAEACRVSLGVMDTLGQASRIAAGLRRETIRKGDGDE